MTARSFPSRASGTIALAAGAALLLSGSSFALWSAQSQIAGGTIGSGNADIHVDLGTWQDVSPEHPTAVEIADLADFTIVPGDVLRGSFAVDVAALGDNFSGQVAVRLSSLSGDLLGIGDGVSIDYGIFSADGTSVGSPIPGSTGVAVTVISADNAADPGTRTVVDNVADGAEPEFFATVTATFDRNTSEQTRVEAQALLGNLTATVSQTRG